MLHTREEAAQLRQGPFRMEGKVRVSGCRAWHVPARGPYIQHRALQGQELIRGKPWGHCQRPPWQQIPSGSVSLHSNRVLTSKTSKITCGAYIAYQHSPRVTTLIVFRFENILEFKCCFRNMKLVIQAAILDFIPSKQMESYMKFSNIVLVLRFKTTELLY